jgi:signal transduction histidine kinase/ligand-binding sensor domain-containing protein
MKALRMVLLCSFLPLFLLMAVSAHALDPGKRVSQYRHKIWRVEDGVLPQAPSWISQTTDGYLQMAAASIGTVRFDGVRFASWSSPIPLSGATHFSLLASKSGGYWIGNSNGVTRVKGGRVIAHFALPGTAGPPTIEDMDGSLWTGRDSIQGPPVCHVTDLSAHCFSKAEGMPFQSPDSILLDGKGGLWIGIDTGLAHWKSGHSEIYEIKELRSNVGMPGIGGLLQDSDGSLWVGIQRPGPGLGLEKFDGRNFRPFVTRNFDGSKFTVEALLRDRDQNIWVATWGNGIYRIHGKTVDHFGRVDGLSSDHVGGLFEDREGIIWVVTSNGIDSFTDRNVSSFSMSEGLSNDSVSSVMASRDGTVWLSNPGSLDYIRNGEVFSIRSGAGLPGFQVTSLLEDHAGQMWVGVDDGLFLYKDHHFRRLPEPNHRPLGMVTGITEDIEGNIWAECASKPRKLVRIRDFRVQEEFSSLQVPAGHSLAADPKGGIWVSNVAGDLTRIQNGAVQTFSLNITGEPPRQIQAEPDGSVLVAEPSEGLLSFRVRNIQRLTKRNGLPCDGVFAFVQDNRKNWWLEAPCGYISIADSEMQRWRAQPDTVVQYRLFDSSDGASTEIKDFNPATKSSDGRLWFAARGLQMIDPRHLAFNKLPPPVHIEQIIADRKAYDVDSDANLNLALPPRVRDLQIDYTALSLVAPAKVRFRYRLEGRDKGWQDPGTRRQAFYSDLWPGHYRFRVIACNNEGVWNETGAVLNFTIAPAWYQTAWFFAFCAMALLLLLWTLYQLRLNQLKHQFSRTLEARVDERTRIARDLHDTLLQSFQGLTLIFRRALNLLPERAPEAIQTLSRALDGADQAIIEGRDAIHDLRSPTASAKALAEEITALGAELAAEVTNQTGPVQFRAVVEGSAHVLRPNAYIDIFRIAREALRNAFNHSQGHLIETELAYTESLFRLRVRDDGKGIDPDERVRAERSGHWGLKGMRERAGRLGGELEVWSDPGAGTEIELRVPASIAYETVLSHHSRWRLWGRKSNL